MAAPLKAQPLKTKISDMKNEYTKNPATSQRRIPPITKPIKNITNLGLQRCHV